MGEWSKRVGEEGESIAGSLLELIGWVEPQKNFDIPCINPGNHSAKGKRGRTSHGIDKLFSYQNPLVNRSLVHAVVSVKCSAQPYPSNRKRVFAEHFLDLAHSIGCFQRSAVREKANKSFTGIETAENVGVLIWLSVSPEEKQTSSILPDIASFTPRDATRFNKLFVVDNSCASFIVDSLAAVREIGRGASPKFFYGNTGRNYDQLSRQSSGDFLPVEYINSEVLLMTSESNGSEKTFIVSTKSEFSTDGLSRLLGLAKEITQDLPARTLILFPDYTTLVHENAVREVKAAFSDADFARNSSVGCYRSDFRNLPNA